MPKRIIIVRRNCHEFANSLWSDMAIYAYAFLVNSRVWNLAAFETGPLAPLHTTAAWMFGLLASSAQYTFLPPSVPLRGKFAERDTVFFLGWLFRNPEGFVRYRSELLERFGPATRENARLERVLAQLPRERIRIGVQLRLKPLRYFPDGEFLVPPERVRNVVDEYLRERGLTPDQVVLVLVADQPFPNVFGGFTVHMSAHNERANFFLLSKCNAIIGTNTTFCNLAAWFGDIPHIVTTKDPIDWGYYANHERYFENAYATFAFGSIDGNEAPAV